MIVINGVEFEKHSEIDVPTNPTGKEFCYRFDYGYILKKVKSGEWDELSTWRELILDDLWFIVYFIMEVPGANRPFVVEACKEVEKGPEGWTLDLWARKHYKTTILTKARTIQRILKYPERCTMLGSHTRPIARTKFLRPIMEILENSDILKSCFPDVLFRNPRAESPKWSEDDGIFVKRKSKARGEATVEAHGVKEGMPISVHFDFIILDDLETKEDVANPDTVKKVRDSVDLTSDLLTEDSPGISIVGTPYSHEGIYIPYVRDLVKADGSKAYLFRSKPATKDGTAKCIEGNTVLLSIEDLDNERARKGEYSFNCQQLINPTPKGTEKLNPDYLKPIAPALIPKRIFKFMLIDQAGDEKSNVSKYTDPWAIWVLGVERISDEIGACNKYILDIWCEVSGESEAIEQAVRMYENAGVIQRLGCEKVGISTTHIHIKNALKAKGRHISEENNSLVLLRPAGRNKIKFIESAWAWPLNNGKWFYSEAINKYYLERLKSEMSKFPFWHDDNLNAGAYIEDILKDYSFPQFEQRMGKIKYAPVPT